MAMIMSLVRFLIITSFKGSPDPSHLIFEINVGKSRILKADFIQIESRSMSDPLLSDIDFKNKVAWV